MSVLHELIQIGSNATYITFKILQIVNNYKSSIFPKFCYDYHLSIIKVVKNEFYEYTANHRHIHNTMIFGNYCSIQTIQPIQHDNTTCDIITMKIWPIDIFIEGSSIIYFNKLEDIIIWMGNNFPSEHHGNIITYTLRDKDFNVIESDDYYSLNLKFEIC